MSVKILVQNTFNWILNVILKILLVKTRKQNIWIFGAWHGEKYNDNSKYFFEYINANISEINAFWITKDKTIKDDLISRGYKCYLYNEILGLQLRLNAGYVFYTNGMSDLGDLDLCHGAKKVALWHGMPLKRLTYATNYYKKPIKNLRKYIKYISSKIYNTRQRDITIATSHKTKEFLIECFELKPENVYVTGQPRNDILFRNNTQVQTYKKLKHRLNEKFILYMPTWRDTDTNNKSFVDDILAHLYKDVRFMENLKINNIKLYIKPHPNAKVCYDDKENVKIIRGDFDSQLLLGASDILITDYSSAFIDFALTDRPIYFYVPDLEEYTYDRLGLFIKIEDLASFWFKDIEMLKNVVINNSQYREKGLLNTSMVNSIYDDPNLKKGKYSENLFKVLKNKTMCF